MGQEYDVVILGGGTGGYVAAIRSSQLGLKTAIVEKRSLGGTCLHRGCIPSKALLRSAEVFRQTKEAEEYGITINNPSLNFEKVQQRKEEIIHTLHQGVQSLIKKGKIDLFHGVGRILGPSIFSPSAGTVSIESDTKEENTMLIPKNVIIATGSSPRELQGMEADGEVILNSEHALSMEKLPTSILIIGGGVIGIEWASMLADFGVKVTVIEYTEQILPTEDKEIAKEVSRLLKKRGINIVTSAKVLPDTVNKENGIECSVEVKGIKEVFQAEKALISVGRTPNTENLGLNNTDIVINKYEAIEVNDFYQTKEAHIYAIGDVIGGMQLAHVASHEGIKAVEHIAGKSPGKISYKTIPSCIYSFPEVASVGWTESQARDKGFDVQTGKIPFKAIGKALINGENDGFVKVISDRKTNDLLGVHMVGPHVTDMISEAGLAMVLDATPWEISQNIHPHPTLSEAIGEAAMAVEGQQIHG